MPDIWSAPKYSCSPSYDGSILEYLYLMMAKCIIFSINEFHFLFCPSLSSYQTRYLQELYLPVSYKYLGLVATLCCVFYQLFLNLNRREISNSVAEASFSYNL